MYCDKVCTSGFVDDVMSSLHNGPTAHCVRYSLSAKTALHRFTTKFYLLTETKVAYSSRAAQWGEVWYLHMLLLLTCCC